VYSELEKIREETFAAYSRYCPRFCPERRTKTMENLRIAGICRDSNRTSAEYRPRGLHVGQPVMLISRSSQRPTILSFSSIFLSHSIQANVLRYGLEQATTTPTSYPFDHSQSHFHSLVRKLCNWGRVGEQASGLMSQNLSFLFQCSVAMMTSHH
jgi:hypothetical protein